MKRILVVEDNRLERKLIQQILSQHFSKNLFIDIASNGDAAIQYLSRQTYDLVITDLIMPKVEGIQLIRLIKDKYPATPTIAISGGHPFYLNYATKLGVEGIFTKPINTEKFLRVISNILYHKSSDPVNA